MMNNINNINNMDNMNHEAIKQTMQFELLNKFKTNNPIYDMLISFIIFSSVAMIINKITEITNYFLDKISKLVNKIMTIISSIYQYLKYDLLKFEKYEYIDKEINIDYITDNRVINELYKAVYWYLNNTELIDYVRESPLKYYYDKRIDSFSSSNGNTGVNYKLNQTIVYNRTNNFKYKDHIIYYEYNKTIIDVYTDQAKKKENYTIKLWTKYSFKTTDDILNLFCQHCIREYANFLNSEKWRQRIFINESGKWSDQKSNNKRSIDTIILQDNLTEIIKNDVKSFIDSENWYLERDIPYTRGYLFYGSPGCGKTSMIKAISNYCERDIYYLMLNNISSDNELLCLLKEIQYNNSILVIEDIDCMTEIIKTRTNDDDKISNIEKELNELKKELNKNTEKRYDDNKHNALTLSGLLNALDGIFDNHGRILIMTSNRPEILDKALIRPGRIDRKINFRNCNRQQIIDIYKMFFNTEIDTSIVDKIQEYKYSPAYISKLFLYYKDTPLLSFDNIDNYNDDFEETIEISN